MAKRQFALPILALFLALSLEVLPAFAHGDKVVVHVPEGVGPEGTGYITKLDIVNLGPEQSYRITNIKVMFFLQNGSPWTIATNLGTGSEFSLDLGAYQTLRLETLGSSSKLTVGYAIVRSSEKNTDFAEDYEVGVSAYYEVRKGGAVIDTVSVAVAQPTVDWTFPVLIDNSRNLHTGFAMVNLAGSENTVTLRLWKSGTPSSGAASAAGTASLTLAPNEQKSVYLYPAIFPNLESFQGMLRGHSEKGVAILSLMQTPTSSGLQYATVAPAYVDGLRRNTYAYLRQGFPLDADIPISDYTGNSQDTAPWDLLYETGGAGVRRLMPYPGATLAVIGRRSQAAFDNDVTIDTLRGLSYSSDPIDLSDASPNLAPEFAFAIKTGLRRYVKLRISDVISRSDAKGTYKDLALEIYIYK
jgi:hypothetical protein